MPEEAENAFLVLGIPFDPPPDTATIQKAISEKQNEWSRQLNNPRKKDAAKKGLAQINEMKQLLLDPRNRNQLAEQAKRIRNQKQQELEQLLALNYNSPWLTDDDIQYLLAKYPYGFTETAIRGMYRAVLAKRGKTAKPTGNYPNKYYPSVNTSAWNQIELIDKAKEANIQQSLTLVEARDLYAFLGCSQREGTYRMMQTIDAKERQLRAAAISDQNEAEKRLCGHARDVFSSEAERRKYDNFITYCRWQDINQKIDTNAETNTKDSLQTSFLKKLFPEFPAGTDYADAAKAVSLYCRFKNYTIEDRAVSCDNCGTDNRQSFFCGKCHAPLFPVPQRQSRPVPQRTPKPVPSSASYPDPGKRTGENDYSGKNASQNQRNANSANGSGSPSENNGNEQANKPSIRSCLIAFVLLCLIVWGLFKLLPSIGSALGSIGGFLFNWVIMPIIVLMIFSYIFKKK